MEEKEEYLNEEKYQKTNKKVNKVGTVLLLIGLLMVISAIVIMVLAIGVYHEAAWGAIGGPLLVFGFAFLGFGGQAKLIGNARNINAYIAQQQIPIAKEGMEKMSPSMGNAAKEVAKGIKEGLKDDDNADTIYCKHCGAKIERDSKFCKECGKEQ